MVRIIELWILFEELEEGRQVALEADPVFDRPHVTVDARDFPQAKFVNLVGGEVRGGADPQGKVVIFAPVGKLPHAVIGGGDLLPAPGEAP